MTDVFDEAKRILAALTVDDDAPECPDCGQNGCGWDRYDRLERLAGEVVPELITEMERLYVDRRLSGQANLLLARIVAAANLGAIDGADGFAESYNLPVGPIHKAIPFLQEQGIVVTADGQIRTTQHHTHREPQEKTCPTGTAPQDATTSWAAVAKRNTARP